ncbi:hypothetical protein DL767_001432 [Monosporascus sp. MG133]|nr:hypothetical protein DL767_001432 [Monosporascus sp. MG133]
MTSLKVLSVPNNRIEELPLCLADMASLQALKLEGNNITFPPREVLQVQAITPPNEGFLKESEVNEVVLTAHIKKFMKQRLQQGYRERELQDSGDEFGDMVETPRPPLKRVASGRFPVKVNGSDVSDMRSPANPRAPPIPSRSHARGLSAQNTALRRPGVMPLTIGNPNERLRSNSESSFQTSKVERPSERHRRMGIVSKRANELGTLDETEANNRFSHYRGLSHGSSMTGTVNTSDSAVAPGSPPEPLLQRPNYVRRLSVLPEQRRVSKVFDPVVESAKGILYSIFQIHPMIQLFTRLTSDGTAKRSSLEIVFYNTNVHVEELEQEIQRHEFAMDNGGATPQENENVQRAVLTLINAYSHICSLLAANMDSIVNNGDPRYIRTMLMLLYNSIMELRVTANEASMGTPGYVPSYRSRTPGIDDTLKPHSRQNSATPTPTMERPGPALRTRPGVFIHNPSNLRVVTDVSGPFTNGGMRTAQIASSTPRSGESFASSTDGRFGPDPTTEERQFDKIFLSLQKSSDLVMRTLPYFLMQFNASRRNAEVSRASDHVIHCWKGLVEKCNIAVRETEKLKNRLSRIKLKEPGVRTDPSFWNLCKSFIDSWAEYGSRLRYSMEHIILPMDTRTRLRPIQISVKETNQAIMASPWAPLFRQAGGFTDAPSHYSPGHYPSNPSTPQVQLPMTPQSAALGPAVQATVPSTPQSASFANAFAGNVFERADALMAMGGLSFSRSGTMNSSISTTSLNSMSSGHDERPSLSNMFSPNGSTGHIPFRLNGGVKPTF